MSSRTISKIFWELKNAKSEHFWMRFTHIHSILYSPTLSQSSLYLYHLQIQVFSRTNSYWKRSVFEVNERYREPRLGIAHYQSFGIMCGHLLTRDNFAKPERFSLERSFTVIRKMFQRNRNGLKMGVRSGNQIIHSARSFLFVLRSIGENSFNGCQAL